MRIGIITPAPAGTSYGNRITALRWARILRKLGHRVSISGKYKSQAYDLLIALHARRSYPSIARFHQRHARRPIIVALTGTDLYRDIRIDARARKALEIASVIVVLQPKAIEELPPRLRPRTQVVYQSVERISTRPLIGRRARIGRAPVSRNPFDVCVIGHLRPVKDPFRTALASRLLPASSRIRVLQIGGAMTAAMAARAEAEARTNQRYRWLGEQPRGRTLRILAKSQICTISSRMEGGANVLSEAIVAAVPVLASRIDGNVGILQDDYPGLFRVGDTRQLTTLLRRAETDPDFLSGLTNRVKKLASLFDPAREERAWRRLLKQVR
jgi:putative glycosyltransferase (TIGR04348 family)